MIFVVEITLKLVAYGPRRFFSNGWNVFDFLVTAIALIPASGHPVGAARPPRAPGTARHSVFACRCAACVDALLHSLPGIAAIAVLMSIIFYVAAVMATVMFGEQFPDWFGDIGKSLYSLFQIMTLEKLVDGDRAPGDAGGAVGVGVLHPVHPALRVHHTESVHRGHR